MPNGREEENHPFIRSYELNFHFGFQLMTSTKSILLAEKFEKLLERELCSDEYFTRYTALLTHRFKFSSTATVEKAVFCWGMFLTQLVFEDPKFNEKGYTPQFYDHTRNKVFLEMTKKVFPFVTVDRPDGSDAFALKYGKAVLKIPTPLEYFQHLGITSIKYF